MFDFEHVNRIRLAEIEMIATFLPPGGRILEIGAGSGQQALALAQKRFKVDAIEVPSSAYRNSRLYPVVDYDGRHFPFPDATFDAVFSSNVLEHVVDLSWLNTEVKRVLRPGGCCVHVMPTPAWRLWTTVLLLPAALQAVWKLRQEIVPRAPWSAAEAQRLRATWIKVAKQGAPVRHGERGNIVSEMWLFRTAWWRRAFAADGFEVLHREPMGLFYTGTMFFGPRLSFVHRRQLAYLLGSACCLFVVRPVTPNTTAA